MRQRRKVLRTVLAVALLASVSLPGVWAAAKTKIRVVTFVYWNGVTGQETNEFITNFKKEKGREPNIDEMPRFTGLEWWNKVTAEYQQAHPDVEIEVSTLDWATGRQRLDVQVAAGMAPDICVMALTDAFKYYYKRALDSINLTAKERSEYDQAGLDMGTYKGKLICLPIERMAARGLIINKRIFAERNAQKYLPSGEERFWTFDQFLAALKATTFQRENGTQVWGYVPGAFQDWPYIFPMLWGAGAQIWNPKTQLMNISDPRLANGLQFMADLRLVHKVIPPNYTSAAAYVTKTASDLWANNQAAVSLGGAGWVQMTSDGFKVGTTLVNPDDVLFVPYPTVSSRVKPRTYGAYNGLMMFKQKDAARKKQILDLMRFFNNPQNNLAVVKALRSLPARPGQAGEVTSSWGSEDRWALEHLGKWTTSELASSTYWIGARPLVYPIFEAVFSGQMTAKEAFAKLGPRVNEWVKQQMAAAKQ